jgi:hypothetical protein
MYMYTPSIARRLDVTLKEHEELVSGSHCCPRAVKYVPYAVVGEEVTTCFVPRFGLFDGMHM